MDRTEVVAKYPTCFHLASAVALGSIQQLGLLSTCDFLELWEVPPGRKTRLTTQLRKGPERVTHPMHGNADIRDQHPMNEAMLRRTLTDKTVEEWSGRAVAVDHPSDCPVSTQPDYGITRTGLCPGRATARGALASELAMRLLSKVGALKSLQSRVR
jgi:hypothetical protein